MIISILKTIFREQKKNTYINYFKFNIIRITQKRKLNAISCMDIEAKCKIKYCQFVTAVYLVNFTLAAKTANPKTQ